MRAPSLRRRVTLLSVAAMSALVVVIAAATAMTLSYRLQDDLQNRLTDRASLAASIAPDTDLALIADRLSDDEITAVATRGGVTETGRAAFDPRRRRGDGGDDDSPRPIGLGGRVDGDLATTVSLGSGTSVTLYANEQQNNEVIARLVGTEILVSALVVAFVGLGVSLFARRALAPLDEMADVAGRIAGGDRELRVRPNRSDTDLGGLATSFDVMVDSLDDAVVRAEASESTMRQFLADASHELRNPTAAIGATAERLVHGDNDREEREALAVDVVRESRRLGRLIGDLLDVSRLDSGQSGEHPTTFDLVGLVRDETERGGGHEPTAPVRLDASAAPHFDVTARRNEIGRVVANLVDNARRHAPVDSSIDAVIAPTTGWVMLAITNDGPRIEPADRELIFERFARLDDARARHTGGTGLGLTISRAIARSHAGDLRCVEPPPGRGATFELWLMASATSGSVPVAPLPASPAVPRRPDGPPD